MVTVYGLPRKIAHLVRYKMSVPDRFVLNPIPSTFASHLCNLCWYPHGSRQPIRNLGQPGYLTLKLFCTVLQDSRDGFWIRVIRILSKSFIQHTHVHRIYSCVYIYTYWLYDICMYVWMDEWMDGCMYVCVYIYICISIYPHIYIYLCLYLCKCIHTYIYILYILYIYILYVYIYIMCVCVCDDSWLVQKLTNLCLCG
jgi:hypothetical protein